VFRAGQRSVDDFQPAQRLVENIKPVIDSAERVGDEFKGVYS
jgi:hypothetical protein